MRAVSPKNILNYCINIV
jgi:hypothetical protein